MSLFHRMEPALTENRLQNVTTKHEGGTQAWNAHEWDVRP